MSTLRTLKKLLLGETWIVPSGIAVTVALSALARSLAANGWPHLGGFVLLAGVLLVLVSSVLRTARKR
jgi:hypothetical protein